jgi:transcription-repair coupling factor (superfamily II helicase)
VGLDWMDLLQYYKTDDRIIKLAGALSDYKCAKIHLKGLIGSSDAMVALALYNIQKQGNLFVLPDREEAIYFQNDLENIFGHRVLFFPSSYKKPFDITQLDTSAVLQRAEVLNELKYNTANGKLIVSYPEAIAEKVIDQQVLAANTLEINLAEKISIESINEFLYSFEFERVDFVYEAGQFAIRGGIVDIFSYSNELPYRIEFFGDHIESIRTFETENQLSIEQINSLTIVPNIQSKLINTNTVSFLNYIDKHANLWIKDVQFTLDIIKTGYPKSIEIFEGLSTEDKNLHPEFLDPQYVFQNNKDLENAFDKINLIEFGKQYYYQPSLSLMFNMKPQTSFNKDFNLLIHHLKKNESDGLVNYIFAEQQKQIERLYSIFEDISSAAIKKVKFNPINTAIREGFLDYDTKIACYTDHQIFDRFYKYKIHKNYSKSQALTLKELRALKAGDYVVHIDHGIGKYAGLEKIDVNGKTQEAIRLIYADGDLLYVNINSLNRISKYSGKDGTIPKTHKLGSEAWEKLKKSTKKKVKDIARDLIKLYAVRKAQKGNAFSPDTYLQNELEASFMFEDTPDQIKATIDFKKDMESPHPMDRLICGDVGFGKTEIAIRAAFKAVSDSKQVAILVPTTILAMQHHKTFKERLKNFPCNIEYVSRFRTAKEIKETLTRTTEGKVDILIGTHRIVSKDIKFKDLGLLIIDEEQKFGVSTKEKLKQFRANVDTLTLTATPIPRTLHFSLMGARDLSIINTPPPNRQPVNTELHVFNEKLIQEAIEYEIDRGGQVFFIHNRVQDIMHMAGLIQKLCPSARIGVGHGQLEGDQLEDVMLKFMSHEFDVLIATTIIESGLDISNANTMIINNAHYFGLSDLHQMRGRVGRSNKKAFCYLLSPPLSVITPEARKRLSAIEEFSDLGSGFNVAMRDLDIRGAGNLLGSEQSGFIAEIGFELYHKILDEAIQELKDAEFKDLFAEEVARPHVSFCQLDTDLALLIPDEYVNAIAERLNLYTELNKITNEVDLLSFEKNMIDRFGPIPLQVAELLNAIRLQWIAVSLCFEKITLKKNVLRGYFPANPSSGFYESAKFQAIISYVQNNPNGIKLKENKSVLILQLDQIHSLSAAINTLEKINQKN